MDPKWDWYYLGIEAWRKHEPCSPPETVPVEYKRAWVDGWEAGKYGCYSQYEK